MARQPPTGFFLPFIRTRRRRFMISAYWHSSTHVRSATVRIKSAPSCINHKSRPVSLVYRSSRWARYYLNILRLSHGHPKTPVDAISLSSTPANLSSIEWLTLTTEGPCARLNPLQGHADSDYEPNMVLGPTPILLSPHTN
jgi:hypothetical protein